MDILAEARRLAGIATVFVWVLALNIALWVLGRAWQRDSA